MFPIAEVINNGIPVWAVIVVTILAAASPIIFTAVFKKLNGTDKKENDVLVTNAAANAVSGASSLINELQSEREYLLRTVKELRLQVDELLLAKARADRLADQVAKLESELIKAHAERDAAHTENEVLRMRVEEAHVENAALAARIESLESEIENLREQFRTSQEKQDLDS